MTSKSKYRELCASEESIPIFSRDWWLDAAAGESNWDVALVEKGDKILAAMPYTIRKKYGLTLLGQPQLTQTLGPWLRPSGAGHAKQLGQQKDLLEGLIDQLPVFDRFQQNWHYNNKNWLPFYWKGFEQSTHYTYVLLDLDNEERLWRSLQDNIRTDIRKASERFKLTVRENCELQAFLELNGLTFSRQGKKLPYPMSLVRRIDDACANRECRKIIIAEDDRGRRHAGAYIIWDENSAYYLMGGSDPELRNSGANSLCLWEAIKFSSRVTKRFDFEGSMLEPIERFFRGFGAVQVPYFRISKTPSRLLTIKRILDSLSAK